jgi:hypothetical protein
MEKIADFSFHDHTPEASKFRFEQALADAEIEGIARDPDGEAYLLQMVEQGIDGDERRKRLKAYLTGKDAHILAAE